MLTRGRPSVVLLSKLLCAIGSLVTFSGLVVYRVISTGSPVLLEGEATLVKVAYLTIITIVLGLISSFAGATFYLRSKSGGMTTKRLSRLFMIIGESMRDRTSFRVFIISSLVYGIFYSVVSSTVAYRPSGVSAAESWVAVPSVVAVVCCGSFGLMPEFVVYLTRQLGILIIPLNLILLFAVSWLAGLNGAVASYAYRLSSLRPSRLWVGGLGGVFALLTACPTCAGLFLLTMVGLGGLVPLALTLASMQGLFVLAAIPTLLAAPFLIVRKVSSADGLACVVRSPVKDL